MPPQNDPDSLATNLASPAVQWALAALGLVLVAMVVREARKIPARLAVLMATAFVDMVGLFFVVPILPFYVKRLVGTGVDIAGTRFEAGAVTSVVVAAFTAAQIVSAPFWGRFSDRFGRRPALLIALAASAIAYVVFGFAESLGVLMLSRIVQGAGGGTVGVIQAYVADSVEPKDRTRALGWLSAATNLGVALGPAIGTFLVKLGDVDLMPGETKVTLGHSAPGLGAAALCVLNMVFAARWLPESKAHVLRKDGPAPAKARSAALRVVTHAGEPTSRVILAYSVAIGAFQGVNVVLAYFLERRFSIDEHSIGYVFMYIGAISVVARVLFLGRLVDRLGEAWLARLGIVMLATGLFVMTLAQSLPILAIAIALMPLGTSFTFPCLSALLTKVAGEHERGLYLGLQQGYGSAARLLMPLVYGRTFDTLGPAVPFEIAAALVLSTLLLTPGLGAFAKTARQKAAPG